MPVRTADSSVSFYEGCVSTTCDNSPMRGVGVKWQRKHALGLWSSRALSLDMDAGIVRLSSGSATASAAESTKAPVRPGPALSVSEVLLWPYFDTKLIRDRSSSSAAARTVVLKGYEVCPLQDTAPRAPPQLSSSCGTKRDTLSRLTAEDNHWRTSSLYDLDMPWSTSSSTSVTTDGEEDRVIDDADDDAFFFPHSLPTHFLTGQAPLPLKREAASMPPMFGNPLLPPQARQLLYAGATAGERKVSVCRSDAPRSSKSSTISGHQRSKSVAQPTVNWVLRFPSYASLEVFVKSIRAMERQRAVAFNGAGADVRCDNLLGELMVFGSLEPVQRRALK